MATLLSAKTMKKPRVASGCRTFVSGVTRLMASTVVVFTLSWASVSAHAAGLEDNSSDLAVLQAKAERAQPRDRCFLYAKLVSHMTDLAGQQFHSGESRQASETLKRVQQYAEQIHLDVAGDSKKLKDTELLMRRTSFRLRDILSESSYEDRDTLEATLMQMDQVQVQLMMQVFQR